MPVIKADLDLCQGYANCVMEAPKFFDISDDGVVVVLQEEFAEENRAKVEAAVRSCPVSALRIEE
ncbi:MAG: ferredoxin [Actinomycetota bacterium]|nr:MAG: ferredoxin [Actinomycetota bacterium]